MKLPKWLIEVLLVIFGLILILGIASIGIRLLMSVWSGDSWDITVVFGQATGGLLILCILYYLVVLPLWKKNKELWKQNLKKKK